MIEISVFVIGNRKIGIYLGFDYWNLEFENPFRYEIPFP